MRTGVGTKVGQGGTRILVSSPSFHLGRHTLSQGKWMPGRGALRYSSLALIAIERWQGLEKEEQLRWCGGGTSSLLGPYLI